VSEPPVRRPLAFVLSVVFGALGLACILLGAVTSSDGVFFTGFAAGVISLIAALTWRSELVAAWRNEHHPQPPARPH
jgi:hypothetical protein